jgi:hypothetical protein
MQQPTHIHRQPDKPQDTGECKSDHDQRLAAFVAQRLHQMDNSCGNVVPDPVTT